MFGFGWYFTLQESELHRITDTLGQIILSLLSIHNYILVHCKVPFIQRCLIEFPHNSTCLRIVVLYRYSLSFYSIDLTINFLATDSFVGEEDGFVTIEMIIGEAQMPFTLTLTPTTIDDVLSDTRLRATDYLHEAYSTLSEVRKATPGGNLENKHVIRLSTGKRDHVP